MLIYRAVMGVVGLAAMGLTAVQRLRGRVGPRALSQRLGLVMRASGPVVWLHGASNGELTSARPVVERLLAARPGLLLRVTANTGTAVAMVQDWGLPGVTAGLAPLDTFGAAARVLRRWRPGLLIVVEGEIWPARLAAARKAGVPVALIGARLSARSAAQWARFAPGLMRRSLAGLTFASAQDAGSAARLIALGLPEAAIGPQVMLKAAVRGKDAVAIVAPAPRDRVLLAASTHPGEEAMILAAFKGARTGFDLLILAPRHPRRSAEVAALIRASGLPFGVRSAGAEPQAGIPVYLADTMGEMGQWYGMAGVTVIGGSFGPLGGHTPFEPAAQGSAILHGPHMENFAEAAASLALADGAVAVAPDGLQGALAGMDGARQAALAAAARGALGAGEVGDLVADLLRLIPRQVGG